MANHPPFNETIYTRLSARLLRAAERNAGGLTRSDINGFLGRESGYSTEIIKRMEADGLLQTTLLSGRKRIWQKPRAACGLDAVYAAKHPLPAATGRRVVHLAEDATRPRHGGYRAPISTILRFSPLASVYNV